MSALLADSRRPRNGDCKKFSRSSLLPLTLEAGTFDGDSERCESDEGGANKREPNGELRPPSAEFEDSSR